MSIRHGLLALLARGPRYGSRLRTEFEARTGGTWPLNIGQVYTTLGRLERDELAIKMVMAVDVAGADVREVVEAQRRHVSRALHSHLRQRADALARAPEHPDEVARLLVLEQPVCHTEAELRGSTSPSSRLRSNRGTPSEVRLLRLTQARESGE